MNAGKSTHLLQANHNYTSNGHKTLILKPSVDDRNGVTKVWSRIGISAEATPIDIEDNIFELIKESEKEQKITAVFVDEAQFFNKEQIFDLAKVADLLKIPVLAYGLKNNFKGELFEGSKTLLELSDNTREIKTICHCGSKATMVLKYNNKGEVQKAGAEIEIGAEDKYVATCRKHFMQRDIGNAARNNLNIKILKENFASTISRVLGLTFKEALAYSEDTLEHLLFKINKEIELANELKENLINIEHSYMNRVMQEKTITKLKILKEELVKENV
jgi:thymidine kinase